jgi:hypothetical protein
VAAFVMAAVSGTAEAQVSRVFVSVTGNDANVCSDVATPCRTFAGGITQVDPQGEVIVIASGSYAGGTITKSVKINVASGVVAFSGLPITVDPGAGGIVVLRGLTLKAATVGTGNGITHQSGTLFVENSVFDGWEYGVSTGSAAEKLFIAGSVFRNQVDSGVLIFQGSPLLAVDDSVFERNARGLAIAGGTARVSNTIITGNGEGADVYGAPGPVPVAVTFQRCEVSSNVTWGLRAGGPSTLRVSESTIVRNGSGLENDVTDPATVETFDNNVIRGNVGGNNLVGTITTVSLQ